MRKKYFSLILAMLLIISGIIPTHMNPNTYAGADATALLSDKIVSVTQNGTPIAENGTLDFNEDVDVRFDFRVPVKGDVAEGDPNYVSKGDTASFLIAEGFALTSAAAFDLNFGGTKVGTLTIGTLPKDPADPVDQDQIVANIVFDGDDVVFDGSSNNVNVFFQASLSYNANSSGTSDAEYEVIILEKNYKISVPALPINILGEKTGTKTGEVIKWRVKVEAQQGANQVSLAGYTFSDDLSAVGTLNGQLTQGPNADGTAAAALDPQPTLDGTTYSYTFPEGTTGPIYLFYETDIAQDYVTNGTRTITNTARILKDSVLQNSFTASVEFPNRWIEKEAATITVDKTTTPQVGTIVWRIIVNHTEASLPNAVVTDILSDKLEFVSARWTTWNSVANAWSEPYTDIAVRPAGDQYALSNETIGGTPHLTKKAILEITTKVKPEYNVGHQVQSISNSATLSWDGLGSGIGTGNINATIGMYPIEKTGGSYNRTTHEIPWTVTVKKSDVKADLRVMDLLVYGDAFEVNAPETFTITGNPAEGSLLHIAAADVAKLTPSYHQKYKPGSFAGDDLGITVYTLNDSVTGKAIADLLLVTEANPGTPGVGTATGINVETTDRTFTFNSIVTNPAIYAANTTGSSRINVINHASLFSANAELNERSASVATNSEMTQKDMLTATNALDPHANRNSASASANAGFNYQDKTVVYRLIVNKNAIENLASSPTADPTVTLGKITITDVLPAGWTFVDIDTGKPFLIYEGERQVDGSVTAKDTEISETLLNPVPGPAALTADFSTSGTALFTFEDMDTPYVILVKATPSDAALENYFSSNKTTTVTNTLQLETENWSGVDTTRTTSITSTIVAKNFQIGSPANGLVTWTIDYKPYDLNPATPGLPNLRIEDTLPVGMDLILDSNGNLDLAASSITVNELVLQINGSYLLGDAVSLNLGDNITYDYAARTLAYQIPNDSPEKGYRLSYLTEVSANTGTLLTNTVNLIGSAFAEVSTNRPYTVSTADAGATLVRSGWVEITKRDGAAPLAGATFTLYTADMTKVFRSGTTGADGKVILRGLPAGTYVLMETAAPLGYTTSSRAYEVVVIKEGETSTTRIDDKTGVDANKLTVFNFQTGTTGHLRLIKKVTGNQGDTTKAFDFTIIVTGAAGTYAYKYTSASGITTFGDLLFADQSASYGLKHNEQIEIYDLPKDAAFTITENLATLDGHTSTPSGDIIETTGNIGTGTILEDATQIVTFTNRKNVTPPAEPTTEASTAPPTTEPSSEPVTEQATEPSTQTPTQTTTEKTPENTPKEGTVTVPEGGKPTVKTPPSNGTVTVDDSGKWTYTPDPDYKGRDQFEILITGPDGEEELILIDIDIEEVPLGPGAPEELPQTGQTSLTWMTLLGLLLAAIGIKIRR